MVLIDELRDAWRAESRDHQLALVFLFALGVALRLMYLPQPMRYDESVTYMYFVRLGWADALSTYTYPNNHLFHTLLAKIAVSLAGNSPWALRVPAFLAGCLVLPATYAVTRGFYGARPALIATALVAPAGVLVLYSTNARGYSLVVLAFLLLLLLAMRLLGSGARGDWAGFVIVATLGLWAVPVMLYPLGTVALWFVLSALVAGRPADARRMLGALAVIAVLTLLAYAPVVVREGLAAVTANRFVTPSGWFEFLSQLPGTLLDAVWLWSTGVPPLLTIALIALAIVAIARHRTISPYRLGIPLAAFVCCAWVLVVNHRAPFPRVWLWLYPVLAMLAATGLAIVLQRWQTTRGLLERRSAILATGIAFGIAAVVVGSFAVLLSRDTGTYRDAEEAAAVLQRVLRRDDHLLVAIPTNGPLDYYLDRRGVDQRMLTKREDQARRVLAIVDAGEGQTLEALIGRSEVQDSTRFTPPVVVAELPTSRIYLFQRRMRDAGR